MSGFNTVVLSVCLDLLPLTLKIMETDYLQNPYNGLPLKWTDHLNRKGVVDAHSTFFPFQKGYLNFLSGKKIIGLDHRLQRIYDQAGRLAGIFGRLVVRHFAASWSAADVTSARPPKTKRSPPCLLGRTLIQSEGRSCCRALLTDCSLVRTTIVSR